MVSKAELDWTWSAVPVVGEIRKKKKIEKKNVSNNHNSMWKKLGVVSRFFLQYRRV